MPPPPEEPRPDGADAGALAPGVVEAELVDGPPPPATRPAGPAVRRSADDDLPVVARLVVEIRSDGRRTVARGALEDTAGGDSVAVEARGNSPLELALGLAKTMLQLPKLGRATVRALLPGRRKR